MPTVNTLQTNLTQLPAVESPLTVSPMATVDDMAAAWLKYLIDYDETTKKTYTNAIRRFLAWTRENSISQPTRADIIAYRTWLKDEGYKETTRQGYMIAVKIFFDWTEREGIYPNVAAKLKAPKSAPGHKDGYFSSRQIKKILKKIDTTTEQGARDYAIVSVMCTTALRTVSIADARIGDLKQSANGLCLWYRGKGHDGADRFVKLTEPVEDCVTSYLEMRKARSGGKLEDNAPLFGSLHHGHLDGRLAPGSISRLAKQAFKKAGVNADNLTAHSLRHTAAMLALEGGADIREVQQLLDHKSIDTTMIYLDELNRAKNPCESLASKAIFD